MTNAEEGEQPDDVGDHASYSKSEDLLIEEEGDPKGFTLIFSTTWSGPYLGSLGAYPDISDRFLEARMWHSKGLLPTAILPQEQARMMESDFWLRELVCRIYLTDYNRKNGRYIYFSKIFVKTPDSEISHSWDNTVGYGNDRPRPKIEANNIRPEFDGDPTDARTGVRGHARGLVSKALLERLDGTEQFAARQQVNILRGPQVEFQIYPCAPGIKIPPDFVSPELDGINAACMDALKNTLFLNAKWVEGKLYSMYVPIRSCAPPYDPDTAKRFTDNTYKRPDKLTFCNEVKLIASDDDALQSNPDGDLFAKVAPVYDEEPAISTIELKDIKYVHDTAGLTDSESASDTAFATTAVVDDTTSDTARLHDTDPVTAEPESWETINLDFSDTESDTILPVKKSCGKRIRSFLAKWFCCIPKGQRD